MCVVVSLAGWLAGFVVVCFGVKQQSEQVARIRNCSRLSLAVELKVSFVGGEEIPLAAGNQTMSLLESDHQTSPLKVLQDGEQETEKF